MKILYSQSFKSGLKDSVSFGLAFIFLYIPIGALGAGQGLGLAEVMATSIFIFSTPLQFMLVQSFSAGLALLPMVLALNSRFVLMSSALSLYLKNTPNKKIMLTSWRFKHKGMDFALRTLLQYPKPPFCL